MDHKKVDDHSDSNLNILTSQIHNEIERLKEAHAGDLERLTMHYREQMRQLQQLFMNELDTIQRNHQTRTEELTKHVNYLEEMSRSQRLMMKDQLNYLKELELRLKDDVADAQKK